VVSTTPAPVLATPRIAEVLASLDEALAQFQDVVRTVLPSSVTGDEARALVGRFSEGERVAASGVALFSPVVVETGSFAKEGHASAQEWLGSLAGTSSGAAKGRLAAAVRAAQDPVLTEKLKEGELSSDQLEVVTKTLSEVPQASAELIDLIEEGASHQELRDAANQLKDAARSRETERLRRARVHANRHFRWHQDEHGGIRGEFLCDEVAWAKVAPILEAEAKSRWKAAGDGGGSDSLAAHRLDAFLDLIAGGGSAKGSERTKGTPSRGPAPRAVVIVDAEALRQGTTSTGEICEIEGIGSVSVEAAIELIGESALHYVIKEGFDIKTVTKSTRDVGLALEVALLVRDRTCGVPHCGKHLGLETDHRDIDFGDDGPTELDNLVRLCPEHHALKTFGGWRLEGSPGHWKWIAPAHPKSAKFIARARKLAAAKAEAQRAARRKPDTPLRT
jgi:hypothetical protein